MSVHAAVTVSSFKVQAQATKIAVTWTTASELNNAGFNILRSDSATGTFTKINANPIPANCLGCIAGSSYSYSDSAVTSGQTYFYKLQSVDNSGGTQLFGPASTSVNAPTATATPTVTRSSTSTSSPTPIVSNTPTFTPALGTPTPTRVATITPAQFTPTRAATTAPAQLTSTPTSIPTKVAIAVPTVSSTANRQPTRGQIVPTAPPTQIALVQVTRVNPTTEPVADEEKPVDTPSDTTSNTDWTQKLYPVTLIGLGSLFGLGALVFGVLGLYLFVRWELYR